MEAEKKLLASITNRERLRTQFQYLSNKENVLENSEVRNLVSREKWKINKQLVFLEKRMEDFGFTIQQEEIAQTYQRINLELNAIQSTQALITWITRYAPQQYRKTIWDLFREFGDSDANITGKWRGKYTSDDKRFVPSEFILGICRLGNKVFGYGAFLDGLYSTIFVKGIGDSEEMMVELFSETVSLKSVFIGRIHGNQYPVSILGNYQVDHGFDKGNIEAIVEKGVLTFTDRERKLIMFSNIRQKIATETNLSNLVPVLDRLKETACTNELIIQKRRIYNLIQRKRTGIINDMEAQLEEIRIVRDILNLLAEIEETYRNNQNQIE